MTEKFQISNSCPSGRRVKFQIRNRSGSILAVFVILMTVLSAFILAAATLTLENRVSISRTYQQDVALNIAEAGINKALWELRGHSPSYTGETGNASISGGEFDVAVTTIDANNDYVTSTAYVPSKANPKYKKAIRIKISDTPTTTNPAFSYAIQAGAGGIWAEGSTHVEGSLYSNSSITTQGSSVNIESPGNAWAVTTITDGGCPQHCGIHGTKTSGANPVVMPAIDLNQWKSLAQAGGTITDSNYSPPSSGSFTNLGPKEFTGSSFSMSSSDQKVNLTGPLYIHGNLNISGGTWKLDDSFGSNGTIVIVDGQINISGNAEFQGNSSGSYILFISTNIANTKSSPAISFTGHGTAENLALYAYNGSMYLAGSGTIVAMTGQTLYLNSGDIEYESGLKSEQFAGGPGGTWEVKEWQEISP